VLGRVHGLAHGGDVVGDAGGRVDLHDQDRLDGMRLVAFEPLLQRRRIDRTPPVAFQDFDLDAQHGGHLAPAARKAAAVERQHGVAAGEDIG